LPAVKEISGVIIEPSAPAFINRPLFVPVRGAVVTLLQTPTEKSQSEI
jgi:hypothetical protein